MCKKIKINNLNGQKTIKDKSICLLRTFALCLNVQKDAFIEFVLLAFADIIKYVYTCLKE